ncbi:MAG: hypothetical protein SFV17_23175 [Candidatus Obscuribacter sp.]|nr:hypothetical protein [Candidatus Melainabacteria bacterium]MDX1989611.1 hypothetical protein [Candidatus Obscuribacter sp.]
MQKNKTNDTICGVTTKGKNHLTSILLKMKILWKAASRAGLSARQKSAAAQSTTDSKAITVTATRAKPDMTQIRATAVLQFSSRSRQT